MKLGVIGTGNIGGTLARKLNAAGHDVLVANSRGREGVRAFANEIGATAVDTHGAAEGVDVVVLSIPFAAVAELPKDLFDTVPQDVPVIDTATSPNRCTRLYIVTGQQGTGNPSLCVTVRCRSCRSRRIGASAYSRGNVL
jgi:predicted dinucleotide-binding enzyme